MIITKAKKIYSLYNSLSRIAKGHLNAILHSIVMPVIITGYSMNILNALGYVFFVWALFRFIVKTKTANKILFYAYLKFISLFILSITLLITVLAVTPT